MDIENHRNPRQSLAHVDVEALPPLVNGRLVVVSNVGNADDTVLLAQLLGIASCPPEVERGVPGIIGAERGVGPVSKRLQLSPCLTLHHAFAIRLQVRFRRRGLLQVARQEAEAIARAFHDRASDMVRPTH